MQLKRIFLLASIATSAIAAPIQEETNNALVQRDLATVQQVFNSIMATIDKMVGVVEKFDGSPDQLVAVQTASEEILKIMDEGTQKIKSSPTMGLMDAINIITPTGTLGGKVDGVIQALGSKKAEFDKLNVSAVVLEQLKAQRASAENLSAAILANLPMPSLLGAIAGPIAKQITNKLDDGIKQWTP